MLTKYQPGARVRIRAAPPAGHSRTPTYIQGKVGTIEAVHGAFRNPETLAYGGDGRPKQPLYLVRFEQPHVWAGTESSAPAPFCQNDRLCIDIYEHWLEPAPEE